MILFVEDDMRDSSAGFFMGREWGNAVLDFEAAQLPELQVGIRSDLWVMIFLLFIYSFFFFFFF